MINITYLPANDPFHAVFRMLVLFPNEASVGCRKDTARILDFYICFPSLISEFRCPRDLIKKHNALKRRYLPNSYQVTPRPAVMFRRMNAAQNAAASSLHSYGFFDHKAFMDGFIARTSKSLPGRLHEAVESHRQDNSELIEFLDHLKTWTLFGSDGLRARSKLEEYRYDDV